jgi:hypothetical protein
MLKNNKKRIKAKSVEAPTMAAKIAISGMMDSRGSVSSCIGGGQSVFGFGGFGEKNLVDEVFHPRHSGGDGEDDGAGDGELYHAGAEVEKSLEKADD